MYLGIDIGSISVKAVVLNQKREVVEEHYVRLHGQPLQTTAQVLADIFLRFRKESFRATAVTGIGGRLISTILGVPFVNEIIAQAEGLAFFHPEVRTIIEIGGEDSKLIKIEIDRKTGRTAVRDFAMNTICAAGTGSFLDQQASRLGVSIEKEFGELALRSAKPPRIAGRCSVFAKTDMIHLQQEATPVHDIVAGLCYALVRNYISSIAKRSDFEEPIAFAGGVAANAGIVKAFEEILGAKILIPEHFATLGAIGAALRASTSRECIDLPGHEAIENYIRTHAVQVKTLSKLPSADYGFVIEPDKLDGEERIDAWAGIDVGSISTNVVIIDRNMRVLARRYLMTAGRPLEAVTQGLYEVGREVGEKIRILGACTTGSGRYLTGDFIGADIVKNEITAHAVGAAAVDPEVDTIFEIGGQDSKYVFLENGAVTDFTMNKVCAAGTGSFLEEQAEKLGVNIKGEFSEIALSSDKPSALGERCTVFMETSIKHLQQEGVPRDSLISGLCYSIAHNYLGKVVEDRRVGKRIFFQGGTAYNRGVKAAFELVTGKKITVPPHHDVLGAIGCAIIAMRHLPQGPSKFRGFDLTKVKYTVDTFDCDSCPNHCEVKRVAIEGEPPLHYGSRCGKFDEDRRSQLGKGIPRLFREREKFLRTAYGKEKPDKPNGKRIGIPQIGLYFELFPFFEAFFSELGFEVVTSDNTNREIINDGLDTVLAEHCFPIKVAYGHLLNVLRKKVDYVFLPCVVNLPAVCDGMERSYVCPYVQALPYLLKSAIDVSKYGAKTLEPVFHFEWGEERKRKDFLALAKGLGIGAAKAKAALAAAEKAQKNFYHQMEERGKEVIANLPQDSKALVIVSRPYNGCDPALNLNIPEKLRDMGVLAIPLDFLSLSTERTLSDDFPHMYWRYGQKILAGARIIAQDPRLYPVYLSNFGCGPDSFIQKFFAKELLGKPCLSIEIDEHAADVGAITRCEAFLDSLQNVRKTQTRKVRSLKHHFDLNRDGRALYVPYMDDHGIALAAALRSRGVHAEALPLSDDKTLELGKKYTTGKECYPCIITTGDILKKVYSPGFDPDRAAFFMPDARGPCRFGQYNRFHRLLLDELGLENVSVVALDQTADYNKDLENLGAGFRRLAWKGIVVTDMLKKMLFECRPYEVNPGEVEKTYWRLIHDLESLLEKGKVREVGKFPFYAISEFEKVKLDKSKKKPKIGIIGEIFVRSNEFTNNFIARKVEQFGGQATLPAFEEWMNYLDYERMTDLRINRDWKGLIAEAITQWVARRDKNLVQKPFARLAAIDNFCTEPKTEHVLELASKYIHEAVRGEATLSMGKCVEYAHSGYAGIINLTPFQCLPGTIVNALLERFKKDYLNMPVLKMAYDGTEQSSEETRIEAFLYQCNSYAEEHNLL